MMRKLITRRRFVSHGSCLGVAVAIAVSEFAKRPKQAWAIEPFDRPKPGRLRLSLAAYSLRDLLKGNRDGWDMFRFVDYCHQLGVPGAELTSYYFPAEVSTEYLNQLKLHCHRLGITVTGGAIANDFCQADPAKVRKDIETTKLWIDRYAILGANVIRIFAGSQPKGDTWESTVARCVEAVDEVGDYAASRGIYLGLENHGGVTAKADGLLEIVRGVKSKGVGINLDSGNFRSTADPYAELAQIAPYAVNAQLKVEMFPNGKQEMADLPRVLRLLSESSYSGWVALEYEAAEPPLEAIPKWVQALKQHLRDMDS
ncbi:MAG: sugar phosphate isomerase/epimerase [Planctomycetes bacterium]|nr:sugar phosphate isomerase/epimerase [Planctomycetota bacterium]